MLVHFRHERDSDMLAGDPILCPVDTGDLNLGYGRFFRRRLVAFSLELSGGAVGRLREMGVTNFVSMPAVMMSTPEPVDDWDRELAFSAWSDDGGPTPDED
ncbi:MAG TPA: hypothetical protein VK395_28600 [Gemmataceae bacterium]|nr:hypothetical protein [Gemmataceae bacterium]